MIKNKLARLPKSLTLSIIYIIFTSSALAADIQASESQSTRLANSSDRNAATTMLYEWWGLFETNDKALALTRFDALFNQDVQLSIGAQEIDGLEKLKEVFNAIPPRQLSHHEAKINVFEENPNTLILEANFIYQAKPEGEETTTGITRYKHTLEKQQDGSLKFSKLTGNLVEKKEDNVFVSSYLNNRARASLSRYLAVTDVLNSTYSELDQILSNESEIKGMFDPSKATFNERGDGVLRGYTEISNWLSTRKDSFDRVAHQITSLQTSPLSDNRHIATVEIATQAWPKNGEKISVSVPVKITFVESDARLMQIEEIAR